MLVGQFAIQPYHADVLHLGPSRHSPEPAADLHTAVRVVVFRTKWVKRQVDAQILVMSNFSDPTKWIANRGAL